MIQQNPCLIYFAVIHSNKNIETLEAKASSLKEENVGLKESLNKADLDREMIAREKSEIGE